MLPEEEIIKAFGNRLRVRISGLLVEGDKILLAQHANLGSKGIWWAPPGGGMDFGELATDTLQREFLEETGLQIKVLHLVAVNEFLQMPLHAVELFFKVERISGEVIKGHDPEMSIQNQIIRELRFLSLPEIRALDKDTVHTLFHRIENLLDFDKMHGYMYDGASG